MPSLKTWRLPPGTDERVATIVREVLARLDPRNADNDFAGGLVANEAGDITLGNSAYPVGRTAPVVTLVSRIANTGKAVDQRFLPTVSVSNRLSAQNTDPLTSSSDATVATITISTHTVQYGAGLVSYSGGTITGLTPEETFFVYGDDADLTGGAVAYTATTDPQVVVAGNSRYYVGVIKTAKNAATANVSAATQANPCAITTSAPHGFDDGDTVTFAGVGGMTQLNALPATAITKTGASTFTLNGIDSSAFGVFTTGGTVTRANTTGSGGTGGVGGNGAGFPWGYNLP